MAVGKGDFAHGPVNERIVTDEPVVTKEDFLRAEVDNGKVDLLAMVIDFESDFDEFRNFAGLVMRAVCVVDRDGTSGFVNRDLVGFDIFTMD